jgi:hypothetical protein
VTPLFQHSNWIHGAATWTEGETSYGHKTRSQIMSLGVEFYLARAYDTAKTFSLEPEALWKLLWQYIKSKMLANVNAWAVAPHDVPCNELSPRLCTSDRVWERVYEPVSTCGLYLYVSHNGYVLSFSRRVRTTERILWNGRKAHILNAVIVTKTMSNPVHTFSVKLYSE